MGNLRPRILFENQHVIAINKHAGQPFHGSPGTIGYFQYMKEILIDEHCRSATTDLYPVHRLDRITSGVLLFAKSKDSAREFQELFSQASGVVHKYYVALSDRKPRKKMGTVSGPLVKARRGSYKLTRTRDDGHQSSVTRFVSKKITVCGEERPLYMFLVKPITGKTHQIRVAMKSLGSPVLGDERYGMKQDASCEERAYLHCAAIRCIVQGERIEILCNPYEDGGYFQNEEFTRVFADEWFSPANTQNPWFPESTLLSSSLDSTTQ